MRKVVVFLAVLAFLITSVPCYAEAIYGCAQKVNGQLRIVSSPNQCRPAEENVIILGGTDSVEPAIPNLIGTWNFSCERYAIEDDAITRTYGTFIGTMVVTLQSGHAFTGNISPASDAYHTLMTGVTNGNQITMNFSDSSIVIGQYYPTIDTLRISIADHNNGQGFGTARCVGTR